MIKQAGEDSSWFVSCQGAAARSLEWLHRTTSGSLLPISSLAQDRVHSEAGHGEGLDLVFRSVAQGDAGEYICKDKASPANSLNFDLVIVQPISFGETAESQMVKLKEPQHRVTCGVSGLPFPTVTWRARGQNIRNNPEVSSLGSKYEVDGTDLIIRNLQKEDEGSYLCKAVQNVLDEDGNIKYSDFKDFVINLKIERKLDRGHQLGLLIFPPSLPSSLFTARYCVTLYLKYCQLHRGCQPGPAGDAASIN